MTSSKSKGSARENQIANYFRSKGYLVMVSPRTMRKIGSRWISSSNDYFGLFDLVVKDGAMTKWIQVKSHMSDYYKSRKKILKKVNFFHRYEILEIWVRTKKDNKIIWRVFCYMPFIDKQFFELTKLDNRFRSI